MPSLLLVKTSSLGDVVHALPVLSDLSRSGQPWSVHWLVEEAFACLPGLHPLTREVIPVALRRWRRALLAPGVPAEIGALRARLAALEPDLILDLQGLVKSAVLTRLARGERHGYDWQSAREPLASLFYRHRHRVGRRQHAVVRNRALAAAALGSPDGQACDYGVRYQHAGSALARHPVALLLHASSRADKRWPDAAWRALGGALSQRGLECVLPSGSLAEWARAKQLAAGIPGALAPAPGPLAGLLPWIAEARLAVGVDTGLTHLAAAFGLPTVALYTATDPAATGVYGSPRAVNLGGPGRCPDVTRVLDTLAQLDAC